MSKLCWYRQQRTHRTWWYQARPALNPGFCMFAADMLDAHRYLPHFQCWRKLWFPWCHGTDHYTAPLILSLHSRTSCFCILIMQQVFLLRDFVSRADFQAQYLAGHVRRMCCILQRGTLSLMVLYTEILIHPVSWVHVLRLLYFTLLV